MIRDNNFALRAATCFGCAAVFFALATAPAIAAPSFEVDLARKASELQVVNVRASDGKYSLCYEGECTPDLAFDATDTTVQAALNALPSIGVDGGSVSVVQNGSQYKVTFDGGALANSDVPELTAAAGTTPLSGGLERVTIFTAYRSEVSRSDRRLDYTLKIKNVGPDPTGGAVSAEVMLPAGNQSRVIDADGAGWTCTAAPPTGGVAAKAICTRSDTLAAGAFFPTVTVATELGADAPEHATATATVTGGGAAPANESDEFNFISAKLFGVDLLDTEVDGLEGAEYTQAGGHPFAASLTFAPTLFRERFFGVFQSVEPVREIRTELPRGFVGNALAVPQLCPTIAEVVASTCPPASAVGELSVDATISAGDVNQFKLAIYAIVPEYGTPVQFGFAEKDNLKATYTLTPHLRADEGYAISLDASPSPVSPPIRRVNWATLCSFGAKIAGGQFQGCKRASDPSANPLPLITAPTRCTGAPPTTQILIDSWAHPGDFVSGETSDPMPTDCDEVKFEPEVRLAPTSHQADSPTGLDVEITMPTDGLEDPESIAQANLNNAIVTFPKGMSVNPSSAHGLGGCSLAEIKLHSNEPDQCPDASKIGTVKVDTPLIRETLTGDVYLAAQKDNPFESTIGIYMAFDSKKDGIRIKVAGKLSPDPVTGQLTSSFVENPEAPFSRLVLHFNSGARAPLINPPKCGTYAIHSELSPWSAANPANPTPDEVVSSDSAYEVTSGPGGGSCPSGALQPNLSAGLTSPVAGAKSPFVLRLTREDGSQRFNALNLKMPKGLTAYLKGVSYCPEHLLAGISADEQAGRAELASPACPASSRVGSVEVGAGAGPFPTYVPGGVYLAGPYKGAPVSLAIVTPAVAGPFDLGNVVVRNALYINPVNSQVTVVSDPIPTILHGLLLDIRDIRVNIDRPGFTAAPTSCARMSIEADVGGADGATANVSSPLQVGGCSALGFRPKLGLRLFGGTKRGAHPRLVATLAARPGDANIAGASVALPHSEFLDQAHIRTICTRVQFAAHACPQGAIYGEAEATTPLLDSPLRGPVYLRSSDNPLPDLVAALRGPDHQPIEVALAGRIDSVNGGIRTTFDAVPDQPVSTFTLRMQGGRKGLLVNSRNLCNSTSKATVKFTAHNGRDVTMRPVLKNSCKKTSRKHGNRKQGQHRARAEDLRVLLNWLF